MAELTFDDLLAPCEACGGRGSIHHPGKSQPLGPQWPAYDEQCSKCYGKGKLLTPSGEVLKQFLRHLGVSVIG